MALCDGALLRCKIYELFSRTSVMMRFMKLFSKKLSHNVMDGLQRHVHLLNNFLRLVRRFLTISFLKIDVEGRPKEGKSVTTSRLPLNTLYYTFVFLYV